MKILLKQISKQSHSFYLYNIVFLDSSLSLEELFPADLKEEVKDIKVGRWYFYI